MALEINNTVVLTAFKPSIMSKALSRAVMGTQSTMNGNQWIESVMFCTNTPTLLPLGGVTQPHEAWFYSNPTFNTAQQASTTITGAANAAGLIRITDVAHGYLSGDVVTIANVAGTTEANGTWAITVITANTFDLLGSTFANAYTSGGTGVLNNSIQIRNGASGAMMAQLFPGEVGKVPLPLSAVPYALANQTGQLLEYFILSW